MALHKCFFAYPELPRDRAESIELFISQANRAGKDMIHITGWKNLVLAGKAIVNQICKEIDQCEVFLCDLSRLNRNVLFELGYAIGRNKRVWITIDPTLDSAKKNYKKLGLLSTIAYSSCENSQEFVKNFFEEQPYNDLGSTILSLSETNTQRNTNPHLFYLKSEYTSDASIELSRILTDTKIRLVIDDPNEILGQPLIWYIQNIVSSFGIVIHFVGDDRESTSISSQNWKYSLISGLSFGLDKPLLMLAHEPFATPLDYNDLLFVHSTAQELKQKVQFWLQLNQQNYFKVKTQQDDKASISKGISTSDFHKINIGEYIAENEQHQLLDYFVPTASYFQALNTSPYLLYIGRKGSGKTANLFQIAQKFDSDKRNFVCTIKPIDYELEGILKLLNSSIAYADTGYLIESLWKYLIYTELANNLYYSMREKPAYTDFSSEEKDFYFYVEQKKDVILKDFTWRLEYAINEICSVKRPTSIGEQRIKLSEILHLTVLGDLRAKLGEVLAKRNKVILLIDNLDKAWDKNVDLMLLAKFLFGLLSSGQSIADEFNKHTLRFSSVNLSLMIFLRSDIFAFIQSVARESDKLNFTRINWNDPILLQRVIEERFCYSLSENPNSSIWDRFFTREVNGQSTKDYLVTRIIPRPRDIIFLCKNALDNAVNHKNPIISKEDIIKAERSYSEMVFNSLLSETEAQIEGIENLLYEFAGRDQIVSKQEIESLLSRARIPVSKLDDVIELLLSSTFLGFETNIGVFEFAYEDSRKKVIQSLSKRVAEDTGIERYKINIPFQLYLEIKTS